MSSISEDEQDENHDFDRLKSIKAFTVDQLYLLHPDVVCPPKQSILSKDTGDKNSSSYLDQNLYQNLVEYEQLRDKLAKIITHVRHLQKKTLDLVDNVWTFTEETPRKIGLCQQGKIAETSVKYKKAFLDDNQLKAFNVGFAETKELICKDFIYYSFESRIKRHKVVTHLSIAYQISDLKERKVQLKSAIVTLIDFIKHLGDFRSEFVLECRNWLRCLIRRFLEQETTDDYRFIIAQLCKGPAGTADWSADLIECKPFEQVTEFESTPHYITHCSALLSELFNNLRSTIRRVTFSSNENTDTIHKGNDHSDKNWSLIDPRFNCSEELDLDLSRTGNTLSESDILKFCSRIPIAQIFRAYVKKCLISDHLCLETDKNYEYIMLKLLIIGTIIMRTYQTGLETFNSIQYGNLIEYLSFQINRTVTVLSDQWSEFKRRLKGLDNALLMRLQVEYDNFILRSILIILELRQSGLWRHLSRNEQETSQEFIHDIAGWSTESFKPAFVKLLQVTGFTSASAVTNPPSVLSQNVESVTNDKTETSTYRTTNSLTYRFTIEWFKEVSDAMLWHILWQFYHNAFSSSCDYRSDSYWLEKFKEKSVIYLFVNKIKNSSLSECNYLLNSITSMLLSRTRSDSQLVHFITTEIFNMSFRDNELKQKVTKQGIRSLIRSAEKFPNLISVYLQFLVNEDYTEEIVDLFRGCSLIGWIHNDTEFTVIAGWLLEYSLKSSHNKIARLLISKILLNSPEVRSNNQQDKFENLTKKYQKENLQSHHCFVDLELRRKLALLLYEASVRHLPENNDFGPQSLGTSMEIAFGGLFCERHTLSYDNLIELAIDDNYQQFYIWAWRLLFTLRLHILNQPETDWNDVQARSGTSRSIKNTVLADDLFHPAPSIQDPECLLLSDGVKKNTPMASFIYLIMTDASWQVDSLDVCLEHLNTMANSGHLTPSLMAMNYLSICHLNDLSEKLTKDSRCLEYYTKIISSNYDATRFASLIISQLQNVKQYRQIQLSQFYISVLLDVAAILVRQLSSSWFSSDAFSLEKVTCLLDYLVRFNFTTQRMEIIRKFYDCSYSAQGCSTPTGWFGSLLSTSSSNASSTKREFLTTLHFLTDKYKKFTWLKWITTECDTLRQEKIWEDLVNYLSTNEEANLDSAIRKVCPQINPTILKSTLPIFSWIRQIFDIVESDLNHPICPLIWYNFFLNYFANSLNGGSVGRKLISQETLTKLLSRLDSLFNYHLYKQRNWASSGHLQQYSLAQLYRAYRLWLQDSSLQDAYVDIDRLRQDYLVPLLKSVMESSTEGACNQYIDIQSIEIQNKNLCQIWLTGTHLSGNYLIKDMIFVDRNHDSSVDVLTSLDDEASDATSLIVKSYKMPNNKCENNKSISFAEEELKKPLNDLIDEDKFRTVEEVMYVIKQNFSNVFEESSIFKSNIFEIDNIQNEITELVQHLYTNKKIELFRLVPCADGGECTGPAKIKFDIEEATIDDRKRECISDRQRQAHEMFNELLLLPAEATVQSTIAIEDNIKNLVKNPTRAKPVIEYLLKWIKEPVTYEHLNGSYHAASNLLKTMLEILSSSEEVDAYNSGMIDICFEHPGSVHIFSPHLSPISCSTECFLNLYKSMCTKQNKLGPTAMFVLLSKFDVNSWLKGIKNKELHHEIINATCSALRGMKKQPDDSFVSTFELFKRHIQVELAAPSRRRPEEITLVLSNFLNIMDEQSLAPSLWDDFMVILGLEKRSHSYRLESKPSNTASNIAPQRDYGDSLSNIIPTSIEYTDSIVSTLIEDIARLAECQLIFDYHAIKNLLEVLTEFFNIKYKTIDITLLEYFKDYLEQFSIVMTSLIFMWLKAIGEKFPDNHDIIWKKFMELWYHWVFLTKNCQNVGKANYSLVANLFVASIRYMILRIPDNTQLILKSILTDITVYVSETREVVYLELTILQRCLKNLPWSSLVASADEFQHMAFLSEQENYNVSDLISHILLQVNIKESLTRVDPSSLPHVAERFATTIVYQIAHLKSFRLHGCYFTLIPVDKIARIANLILARMEFVNLEHSQNNKLLVNLLRFMCIKLDKNELNVSPVHQFDDSFERFNLYAQFVSNYFIDLIKNHSSVLKYQKNYLYAIMDNSLRDLRILELPDIDISRKITIYRSLLECCSSSFISAEARLLIARSLIRSELLKNRPIVVMEVFHSVGQIINDGRVLVYMLEKLINLYLSLNGHYEKVWKSFCLKGLPSDLYLEACIEENASLALLVYFESLIRNGQEECSQISESSNNPESQDVNYNKIWSSFFHWISKISDASRMSSLNDWKSNDIKLLVVWLRLLNLFEPNLKHFIQSNLISSKENEGENSTDLKNTSDEKEEQTLHSHNASSLYSSQKSLLEFVKQLISLYDSYNTGGFWSYIKSTRGSSTSRIGIIGLAIACFLSDRTLTCLNLGMDTGTANNSELSSSKRGKSGVVATMQDDFIKLRKNSLSKLEGARKSKNYLDVAQFIEALIESVNRNDKVQYSDGVQLMTTFMKSIYSTSVTADSDDFTLISKILPSFNE